MRDKDKRMGAGLRIDVSQSFGDREPRWDHFCNVSCRIGEDGSSDVAEIYAFGISLCVLLLIIGGFHVTPTPHCRPVVDSRCRAAFAVKQALERLVPTAPW